MTFWTRLAKVGNPYHDAEGRFASADATMSKVSGKLGSNPGGIYTDNTVSKHYVKFYSDPQQGRVETLASSIFEDMGVRTPSPRMMKVNGQEALVTRWNADLQQMHPSEFNNLNESQKEQVAKMYMAAILTKNWDVVGLVHDNIVKDKNTGDMVEVDTGGSFHFRAQGGPKPYGNDITEYKSLRNPELPAGQVFNAVFKSSPGLEQKALQAVKNLDIKAIGAKFKASGLSNQAALFDAFKQRRQALLDKGGLS